MAQHTRRESLTCERLIVCEGSKDEAFFRALIDQRGLGEYCLRVTADASKKHGVDGFPDLLNALPTWEGAYRLRHIVLVADNDTNATAAFTKMRNAVASARPDADPPFRYGVPDRAMVTANGQPATMTIIMMPKRGRRGTLETLLLESASSVPDAAQRIVAPVNRFADDVAAGWPESPSAKLRMQALIGASFRKNPSISVSMLWSHAPRIVPLDHPCFDDVASVLTRLS